ncbi:formyltetrahydrofolate deformylase [Allokutzneria albata]|uniref:Formyltetrahydrofolate deformylase n=1 Tax=Allokutzneria albata TaxID=211114 RepID=A0A1G9S9E5_ALLAB|nr:formyltetrahydrofolate deformylase [Allokutzneria albata]
MGAGEYVLVGAVPGGVGAIETALDWVGRHGLVGESRVAPDTAGNLFVRLVFSSDRPERELRDGFAAIGTQWVSRCEIHSLTRRPRLLVLGSQQTHCAADLLDRWANGLLDVQIAAVVSNHSTLEPVAAAYGVPFTRLRIDATGPAEAEEELRRLVKEHSAELVVLARYMRILSPQLCAWLDGRDVPAINVHHSLLPSFVGARPYRQAATRGVKGVGATAHYVTAELDQGPIIAQQWRSASHLACPGEADLARLGRDAEVAVLAEAVRLHCQHRVLRAGDGTTVVLG